MLRSLATGVGVAPSRRARRHSTASRASRRGNDSGGESRHFGNDDHRGIDAHFLDRHAFDTLATLSEQIVPGSRASKCRSFSTACSPSNRRTRRSTSPRRSAPSSAEAREAHGKPWKALTAAEATALLTKISERPDSDATRQAFEGIKGAVAETYFSTEAGMKELGWNGSVAFPPPAACG